jgi:hypothetical protein
MSDFTSLSKKDQKTNSSSSLSSNLIPEDPFKSLLTDEGSETSLQSIGVPLKPIDDFDEVVLMGTMNQEFMVDLNEYQKIGKDTADQANYFISLSKLESLSETAQTNKIQLNSRVIIEKKEEFKVKYMPISDFKGEDRLDIYVINKKDLTIQKQQIIIQVAFSIHSLKPALAVRATGCILCHATVSSNIITDFGYKGDGGGNDYFFNEGIYGDGHGSWDSAKFTNKNGQKKVVVPAKAKNTKLNKTIAEYLKPKVQAKGGVVEEALSVWIGAPKEETLKSTFHLTTGELFRYIQSSKEKAALVGLQVPTSTNKYFEIKDTFNCEGDLFIDGVLLINKARLTNKSGCRLYVTKTVFIQGDIQFNSQSENRNLQITSSRGIFVGMSTATINGRIFAYNMVTRQASLSKASTIQAKSDDLSNLILKDSQLISNSVLLDATGFNNRNVTTERLLLNAPHVHSRYTGNFSGAIIAEVALFTLGQFKFEFDPVFERVPVLPFISQSEYLQIEF